MEDHEVLAGYRALSGLYPKILPMIIWRGWEYAAYRKYTLDEPVLDLGCGDGEFFRLVWPHVHNVIGVDYEEAVAKRARTSGVYREVLCCRAHEIPFKQSSFSAVFANCSLEHMDCLDDVLRAVSLSLRPGGKLLCSVVTEHFCTWMTLPLLVEVLGIQELSNNVRGQYLSYHHLVNPLSVEDWKRRIEHAGLTIEDHVPILPEVTGRLFLLFDQLWHVAGSHGEIGDVLYRSFSTKINLAAGLEQTLEGILSMEQDRRVCCGAVFSARKS